MRKRVELRADRIWVTFPTNSSFDNGVYATREEAERVLDLNNDFIIAEYERVETPHERASKILERYLQPDVARDVATEILGGERAVD